jgi:hypothetical protein
LNRLLWPAMSQHHQFLKAIRLSSPEIRRQALEYAPRHPDHAVILAYLDPELHGLPLGIPAGVLGEGEEDRRLRFYLVGKSMLRIEIAAANPASVGAPRAIAPGGRGPIPLRSH